MDTMIKKMWCINTPFGYTEKGNMTFAEKLVDPDKYFAKKNKSEKDKFFVWFCFWFFFFLTSSVESSFKYTFERNEIEG